MNIIKRMAVIGISRCRIKNTTVISYIKISHTENYGTYNGAWVCFLCVEVAVLPFHTLFSIHRKCIYGVRHSLF